MTTISQRQELPAKRPLTVAAGPYGHPFHPILVTVPIGAWIASLIFDIGSRVSGGGSTTATRASYWLIGIGVIGALVAALFGLLDLLRVPRSTRAMKVGLTHLALNLTVVGLFIGDFFWRRSGDDYELARVRTGQLVLSAIAIALLGISGWLGGMLTYRFGVRVADEGTQAEGFR